MHLLSRKLMTTRPCEELIHVQRSHSTSIALPTDLAARAAFLARVHRQSSMEAWLRRIITERIELEEAAFVGAKRELAQQIEGKEIDFTPTPEGD